jgi:cytochrome c oxidase subunit 2
MLNAFRLNILNSFSLIVNFILILSLTLASCFTFNKNTIYNDSPEPWAIGFQDGVSPGYTGIIELHDNIFFYLVVIAILVFWMLGSTIYYFNYDKTKITHKYLVHGTLIEILWTIFPAIVLLAIAIPSFRLLYILDEVTLPTITVKVTGHQWYWSYEYSDYETESGDPIEFDSYMIPDSDLEIGQTRLLEVDNPIVLPENTHVRFIVTSTDVLHDFAIPAAGIKIDATPGRLNQSSFFSEREGELFGQCSELCGTYHGFMPIQVEVGSVEDYLSWISSLAPLTFFNNKNSFFKKLKVIFRALTSPIINSYKELKSFFNQSVKKWLIKNFILRREWGLISERFNILINLNLIFFIGFLIYKLYLCIGTKGDLLGIFVFILTTIITSILINKEVFSNNIFVRIIQITIFYTIIVSFSTLFLFTFILSSDILLGDVIECSSKDDEDQYYKLPKKVVDRALDVGSEVIKSTVEHVIPNIGAGAAAGSAASTILKVSSALPPAQRMALAGASAFVVGAGAQAGLVAGTAIAKNTDIQSMIKNSPHSDPNLDRIPSPDPIFLIQSPLEKWEIDPSPLEIILSGILSININILLLLFILSYFLISKYVLSSNKNLFLRLLNFILLKLNLKMENIERIKTIFIKGEGYNDKFLFTLTIIIVIFIIAFFLLNMYFIYELNNNLDSYVDVYNYLHNKCTTIENFKSSSTISKK